MTTTDTRRVPRPEGTRSPSLPALVALVDAWNAHADAELADLRRRGRAQGAPEVACTRGCAACCTYSVSATTPEAARIAAAVQAMPRRQREAALGRLQAWEREWRAFERREPAPTDMATEEARDARWSVKRKACPFLDLASHDCTVYAVRPTCCRAHHACHVPPQVRGVPSPKTGQPAADPGEGCFTAPEDAARGHQRTIWLLSSDLIHQLIREHAAVLNGAGLEWEPGVMPLLVLAEGRRRFGWRPMAGREARGPVPALRSAFAREEAPGA